MPSINGNQVTPIRISQRSNLDDGAKADHHRPGESNEVKKLAEQIGRLIGEKLLSSQAKGPDLIQVDCSHSSGSQAE
ncbi:MAG: hypothetical protein H0T51_01175 [Pirellulales bacterium]|nr:hypothetical protein [Pirellulales bacterium]